MIRLLERLGLDRRELRAWAMYDWANSAFQSTIITAVFPTYFTKEAAAALAPSIANQYLATATTIALSIIAVISPILGAVADYAGVKKKMLGLFMGIGVSTTTLMAFISRGDWLLALILFVIANIGVSGSFVFYDSLLPHIAGDEEMDRVSAAGYAIGYLGGGLLLSLNLAWIVKPAMFGLPSAAAASRLSFVSVAVWWLIFSVPLFRRVPEPARRLEPDEPGRASVLLTAFRRLGETFRELRAYKNAFLLLVAFAIYNDGINTIIRLAGPYGAELGIAQEDLIAAVLLVQFVGVPFAFLFGMLAGRIGAKNSVFLALAIYTGISIWAYHMTDATEFYVLALMVATVQGGSQALSRSMFASMIPRHKSSEFFGFFGVFEKFAGIAGPAVFAATIAMTGSSRNAVLSVIAFFAIGAALLSLVDVAEGQRVARAADAAARPARA
ncbi:MAG: MFS transporter [Acidobacteria bacterium]|nr:MFS transporter [Acidobacteriota bacterium]